MYIQEVTLTIKATINGVTRPMTLSEAKEKLPTSLERLHIEELIEVQSIDDQCTFIG